MRFSFGRWRGARGCASRSGAPAFQRPIARLGQSSISHSRPSLLALVGTLQCDLIIFHINGLQLPISSPNMNPIQCFQRTQYLFCRLTANDATVPSSSTPNAWQPAVRIGQGDDDAVARPPDRSAKSPTPGGLPSNMTLFNISHFIIAYADFYVSILHH